MSITATPLARPIAPTRPTRITPARVLAALGAVVVIYELITWTRWLAAGPQQITEFRNTDTAAWTVTWIYQVLIIPVALGLLIKVVRECRSRSRLTFDAQLMIAGVAAMFFDPFVNFVAPAFFYSSNWLNLNAWTGFAPLVINPDASRQPEPIFIMLVYPFGLLAFAMLITAFMRRLSRARPDWPTARIVIAGSVFATVCGMALEAPMFLLHLWSLPGAPRTLSLFDNAHRYSPVEFLTTGMVFAGWGIVRYLKDDQGRTFTERGMSTGGSVLALIGWCTSLMMILCLVIGFFSFHASPYPRQFPRHLVNGMCDVGATQNTRYGPCPGSPGFRMPTTLPGKAPFS